jgi:hypothetical protein
MRLRARAQLPPPPPPVAASVVRRLTKRAIVPAAEPDPQRRSRRVRVTTEVSVRKVGSFSFQLAAPNVSTGGCRVELVEMVDVNERVIVRLPALEPLGAEVAWVEGAHAGLRFQRPLHPAVFDQLIDRFGACAA